MELTAFYMRTVPLSLLGCSNGDGGKPVFELERQVIFEQMRLFADSHLDLTCSILRITI